MTRIVVVAVLLALASLAAIRLGSVDVSSSAVCGFENTD